MLPRPNSSTSRSSPRYFSSKTGRRISFLQDQEHHPTQEIDGRVLPTSVSKDVSMQLKANNVRFLFDGERLHENQTPKDLNMENGDEIDVVIEQVGGSSMTQ